MSGNSKLDIAVWECDRHLLALRTALKDWEANHFQGTMNSLESNIELMRLTDQILFRFAKLQDAIGIRLIPATLSALKEPIEEWPMLDRLTRLEKLGYLNSESWLEWREIRNRLSHEYPDEADLRFANLLSAIAASKLLSELYQEWRFRLLKQELLSS